MGDLEREREGRREVEAEEVFAGWGGGVEVLSLSLLSVNSVQSWLRV